MKKFLLLLFLLPLMAKAQNCRVIENTVTSKTKKIGLLSFSPSRFPTINLINEGDGSFNFGYAMKCSSARVLPESIYLVLTFDDGVTKKISIKQTSGDRLGQEKEFYFFLSPIAREDIFYFKNHLLTSFHASLNGDDQLEGMMTVPKSTAIIVSQTAACVTE